MNIFHDRCDCFSNCPEIDVRDAKEPEGSLIIVHDFYIKVDLKVD
jgi:hypothetical protein